jgi:hypothetical protein
VKNNSLVTCSISTIVSIKAVSHTAIRGVFLSLFLDFVEPISHKPMGIFFNVNNFEMDAFL